MGALLRTLPCIFGLGSMVWRSEPEGRVATEAIVCISVVSLTSHSLDQTLEKKRIEGRERWDRKIGTSWSKDQGGLLPKARPGHGRPYSTRHRAQLRLLSEDYPWTQRESRMRGVGEYIRLWGRSIRRTEILAGAHLRQAIKVNYLV